MFGDVSNDNDTKKLRRNQIFEDGFDFTLASARKGMAKLAKGFDKTKASPGWIAATTQGQLEWELCVSVSGVSACGIVVDLL